MSSDALPPVIHIGRSPEIVCLSDRDILVFVPDTVGCYSYATSSTSANDSSGCGGDRTLLDDELLGLSWRYDDPDWAYICPDETEYPKRGERVLMWYRLSQQGELKSNPRFVYYINSDSPDVTGGGVVNLALLREVISPKITYDSKSNSLTLLYWTNYKEYIAPGTVLDPTKIVKINEDDFTLTSDVYKTCYRTLCCAFGRVHHMDSEGGYAEQLTYFAESLRPPMDSSGSSVRLRNSDMFPLFNRPTAIGCWPIWQADLDQDGNLYNNGRVPILDFIRGAGGGGGGGCVGAYETPKDLTYPGVHTDTTRGTLATWDRTNSADAPPNFEGVIVTVCVGLSYNPAGALKMWVQDFTYDSCGMLVKISEEREAEIDRPKDC
jgi:hypothetical protein